MMSQIRHSPVAPTRTLRLATGGRIDAHRHDEHQIVYAARGVVAVHTDEGSWVSPGTTAIWVPAGTVHAHRAYGEVELRMVGLPAVDNPLGLEHPTNLAVGPLLRELILAYTADPNDRSAQRERLRAVLLDQLTLSPRQPLHIPTPSSPMLARVCAALESNPGDRSTLAQFGERIGASERTLSRLFRDDLGMTFTQWRTQVRLRHALILLAQGRPVAMVAHACGWTSTSAFIDVFRRVLGSTPHAHRR